MSSSIVGNKSVTRRLKPKFATTATEIALPLKTRQNSRLTSIGGRKVHVRNTMGLV